MYKPLNQTVTDEEDSELDDLSLSSAKVLYSPMNKPGVLPKEGPMTETTGNYTTVDMNGSSNSCRHSENNRNATPFTLARKVAFALSVFNCLALVIVFVWVLPCDYNTCRAPIIKDSPEPKWETKILGIVVEHMDVVQSEVPKNEVLVASFRSNSSQTNSSCSEGICYGFLGLSLFQGKELWRKYLNFKSDWMDCRTLDVNEDGTDDCLVGNEERGLVAIDAKSGLLLWQVHSHVSRNWSIDRMLLRKVRPFEDLDGDSVKDLVTLAAYEGIHFLCVISGRSGEILFQKSLNNEYQCAELVSATTRQVDGKTFLVYDCNLYNGSGNVTCHKCSLPRSTFPQEVALVSSNGVCPDCSSQISLYVNSHLALRETLENSLVSSAVYVFSGSLDSATSLTYRVLRWNNQMGKGNYEVEETVQKDNVAVSRNCSGKLVERKTLLRKNYICPPGSGRCAEKHLPFVAHRSKSGLAVVTAELLENGEHQEQGTLVKKDVI